MIKVSKVPVDMCDYSVSDPGRHFYLIVSSGLIAGFAASAVQ